MCDPSGDSVKVKAAAGQGGGGSARQKRVQRDTQSAQGEPVCRARPHRGFPVPSMGKSEEKGQEDTPRNTNTGTAWFSVCLPVFVVGVTQAWLCQERRPAEKPAPVGRGQSAVQSAQGVQGRGVQGRGVQRCKSLVLRGGPDGAQLWMEGCVEALRTVRDTVRQLRS